MTRLGAIAQFMFALAAGIFVGRAFPHPPVNEQKEAIAPPECLAVIDYYNGIRAKEVGMAQSIQEMAENKTYQGC